MSKNRYVIDTILEEFVNVYEPSGKFNNCGFAFKLDDNTLTQAEQDREELLKWAKSKVDNPKRMALNPPKWDESGLVKYSYLGDTRRPEPIFVDTNGDPVEKSVLKNVRRGTKVKLIVQQTPYTKPSLGTTLKVLGVQIIELSTGSGAVDSGDLSVDDVNQIFGTTEGYKQSSPSVRKEPADLAPSSVEYDF
tara:strand:- start:2772 stop:3347 length:576 start_codon:yes stop_codon:yes gene_type:complete